MTASLESKWAKKESGETAALFRAASAARARFCQERGAAVRRITTELRG
jgi:hypothetical protein